MEISELRMVVSEYRWARVQHAVFEGISEFSEVVSGESEGGVSAFQPLP